MTASFNLPQYSDASELDETRQRRAPLRTQIVWDNVTSKAPFLKGIEPEFSFKQQKSIASLAPGQFVEFFVPAHELVRVVSCDVAPLTGEVEIWTSDGSGMYRKQNGATTVDGCSMVAAPDHSGVSIARVYRPATRRGKFDIALFTSRRTTPKLLDYYQCAVINGNAIQIKDNADGKAREYAFLPQGSSKRLKMRGAKRLRIESRLKYGLDTPRGQAYWLRVYVDGVLHRILTFETRPESRTRTFVDDCERLIGRREFAYLDIDCGDRIIEIKSTHDTYVRVDGVGLDLCRPDLNRSFTFPSWENAQKALSIWDASPTDTGTQISESYVQGPKVLNGPSGETLVGMDDSLWDPYLNQQRILGLSRNNRIPHGGLHAYMWARAIASLHYGDSDYGDEISVPQLASRMRQKTKFVDLIPEELLTDTEPRRIAFSNPQTRGAKDKATETIVGEQHLPGAVASVPMATVFRLPYQPEAKLRYRMPSTIGATMLRLIVDQTHLQQDSVLMVRFDDRPPIELTVHPNDAIKQRCFVPGSSEAALSTLAAVHPHYDSGTAGGPFAMWNHPAPLVQAATAEIVKPAEVKNVEIWLASCKHPSVQIGLQYLDGRTTSLSESSFRALNSILVHESANSTAARFANQELENNSVGTLRLLNSHRRQFDSSVDRSSEVDEPVDVWEEASLKQMLKKATQHARTGAYPEAIALWTNVIRHSNGKYRRIAILSRANALKSAGEHFLAEREWRGWLRYSSDSQVISECVERLLDAAGDNSVQREMILAFAAIRSPDNSFELQLAQQLLSNGRYHGALMVLSSMMPNDQNQDILLRCSYQLNWWKLFDETIQQMHDLDAKNLWMGLKALKLGKNQHARRLLQSCGVEGSRWLEHWQRGDDVFRRLASPAITTRLNAIEDWEQWQADSPGERRWVEEPWAIKHSSGVRSVHIPERRLQFQSHLARSADPATISLHGPARIRLHVRPIHAAGQTGNINDWLLIRSGQDIHRTPIINNSVSTTTVLDDQFGERPGSAIQVEIDLPPGLNQFHLHAAESDILFKLSVARPEIRLPVLPHVNETTIASIIKGSFANNRHSCKIADGSCKDCVRMICRDQECRSVPLQYASANCSCNELHSAEHYLESLPSGTASRWQNRITPTPQPLSFIGRDSEFDRAIEAYFNASVNDAEIVDYENRMRAIVQLHRQAEENPNRQDIDELSKGLMSGMTWESFRIFDSRAGIHSFRVEGWTPETPASRLRKALFGSDIGAHTLSGSNQLTVLMNNQQPTEIEVVLRRPRFGFIPMGDTNAVIETKTQSQRIPLSDPNKRVIAHIKLNAGAQTLQISHAEPLANHYIHVDLNEVLPDGSIVPIDHEQVKTKERMRIYQVATEEEPLRFRAAGPALLRIDRNDDGVVTHQHIAIENDKEFAIAPPTGQDTMLLRVFQLVPNESAIKAHKPTPSLPLPSETWASGVVQAAYEQVDYNDQVQTLDQLALRAPDLLPITVQLNDAYTLGLQRLGTIAISSGFVLRDAVEEFPNVVNTGEFFEFKVGRHIFDQWKDSHSVSEFIFRPRLNGGATFGLNYQSETSIPLDACETDSRVNGWGAYQISWRGYGFMQWAGDGATQSANSNPWSLGANAQIRRNHQITPNLHHQPTAQVFARTLSENRNDFGSGELDQDVFTQYKSDHRYGVRISDRIVHQSCLDRRIWASPTLMTNPDEFTPDNIGIRFGADQLLGPIQLRLAYRLTGFLADKDRAKASLQNVVYMDLIFERWHDRTHRSEFSFSMRNDLNSGRSSIGVNFVSFLNHARGYRDLRPSSTLFRPIRQERAAKHYWSRNR